jgi:hypothetical protein
MIYRGVSGFLKVGGRRFLFCQKVGGGVGPPPHPPPTPGGGNGPPCPPFTYVPDLQITFIRISIKSTVHLAFGEKQAWKLSAIKGKQNLSIL